MNKLGENWGRNPRTTQKTDVEYKEETRQQF